MVQFGIYAWKNKQTGRMLVGQTGSTVGFQKRKARYIQELKAGRWSNTYFQRSWNKHGKSAFEFIVLRILHDDNELTKWEQHYVDYYCDFPEGVYNQAGPVDNPRRGATNSPEHRAKISKALKGKSGTPWTEEQRRRFLKSSVGKKRSPEARKNISKGKKGMKFSEEHRNNLSKSRRRTHTTEDYREKALRAQKNRVCIECTDPNGQKKFYESLREAERDGYDRRHISRCIKGICKTHKKCTWRSV